MNNTPESGNSVLSGKTEAAGLSVTADCWAKIGVLGDRSCPDLATYIHCRNCPVYANAALQLLNRPSSPNHRAEWTEHYALPQKLSTLGKISVVIFRIGFEWLALPTQSFLEIAEHRRIHSIPHRTGNIVMGLVNIRGELMVCVSLGHLLDLENTAVRERRLSTIYDRLVVVAWNGHRFVFPADEVFGIQRLHPDEVKDPPATIGRSSIAYSQGIIAWQNKTVGLLDAESVFAALDRSLA